MQCPGQDSRYWSGEDVFEANCKHCGNSIEFFKDDSQQKCRKCGHKMLNPNIDFGCAAYCPHAEQCLGSMPPELVARQGNLFKDRIALAMRKYFGSDIKRIEHAIDVARHAEIIGKEEKGSDPMVIIAAAYLHDIGIKNSEEKYNSSSAKYQHIEGPPVAREILSKMDAEPALIDEVCDIIGHHHVPKKEETVNYKVIFDADMIVNMSELYKKKTHDKEQLEKHLSYFMTMDGAIQGKKTLMEFIK